MNAEPQRVLVVEDDPGLAQLFVGHLQRTGLRCDAADSAKACLAWLERSTPDLLLLDYSLPDMLAPALVAELQKANRLPPFIVVTGHGDERVAVELMKLGARDYLVKDSVVFDRLTAVVHRTLQEVENERRLAATEAALHRSEALFRRTFDDAPIGAALVGLDQTFQKVNAALCRFLGYTAEELLGMRFPQITHPDDAAASVAGVRQLVAGEIPAFEQEKRYLRKEGIVVWGQASVGLVRNDLGQAIHLFPLIQDITERKRAEEALRASEERYRLVAENVSDVIWVLDLASNRFVYVSPSVSRLRGFTPEEILAQDLTEAVPAAVKDPVLALLRERTAAMAENPGRTYIDEVEQLRRDGSTVWTEVTTRFVSRSDGGVEVFGVSRDISERRRNEAALRESEARLRRAERVGGFGHWELDFSKRVIRGSEGASRIYGLEGLEWPAGIVRNFPLPTYRAMLEERLRQTIADGTPYDTEFEIRRPSDGRIVAIHSTAEYNQAANTLFGIIEDVTARKRMELALKESEERFRTVVEKAPVAVFVQCEMRFAYLNPAALRLYAATSEAELLGQSVLDRSRPDFRAAILERIRRLREGDTTLPLTEQVFLRLDGSEVEVEVSSSPIVFNDRPATVVMARDVTERKRAERELARSAALLEQTLAQSPNPMVIVSMPDGIFRTVNPACRAFLGLGEDPCVGTAITAFVPPYQDYDQEGNLTRLESAPLALALQGKTTLGAERRIVLNDGTVRWGMANGAPIFGEHGEVIAGCLTMVDITEKRKALEAQRESEEKFAKAFRNSPVPMAIRDLGTDRYIDVNDRCLTLMGYAREEVVGHSPMELNWMDEADREENRRILTTEDVVLDRVLRLRRKDGLPVICSYSTQIVQVGGRSCVLSTSIDVTERERMEAELRESEARYRLVAENVSDVIWVFDLSANRFRYVSPSVARLRGLDPTERLEQQMEEALPPEMRETMRAQLGTRIAAMADDPDKVYIDEFEMLRRGGSTIWTEVSTRLVRSSDGRVEIFGVTRDISKRRHAEDALREKSALLEAQLDSSIEGILIVDPQGKKVIQNRRMIELWKMPPDIAANPDDQVQVQYVTRTTRNPDQFLAKVVYLYSHQDEISRDEVELTDGTILDRYSAPVRGAEGTYYGRLWAFRDVTEHRRYEAALQESEAFRKRIFDSSAVPIVVMDAQSFRYLDCNPAAVAIYGSASREATLDRTSEDFSAPLQYDGTPSKEKIRNYIEQALEAGKIVFEWRHQRPTGDIWDAEVNLMRFESGPRTLLQFTLQDITQRKRAEAALRESEEKFATSFRACPESITLVSAVDGRYIDINQVALETLGWQRHEVVGCSAAKLGLWVDLQDRERWFGLLRSAPRVRGFETRFRMRSGEIRYFRVSSESVKIGGQACYLSFSEDITDHRQAVQALRESEEKFATVFRDAPVMIAITDLTNGKFVDINDEASRISGFSRSETVGHTGVEIGWLNREGQSRLYRAARKHGRVAGMEMTFWAKGGRVVHGWISGERISLGGRSCLLTVATDLTERKRAEEIIAWEAALMENSADVCCVKDLDLRVRAVNSAFLNLARVDSAAAVLGKTDAEIFAWPGNEANMEGYMADERRVQLLGPGESVMREETFYREDGADQILLTRKFPVFDGAGRLIATANISTDVTAHRLMEQALQHNERRYRLLFASNVSGVALHEIICDAAGRPCNYRFLEVNLAFERLTGLKSQDLVGRTVLEVMPQTEPVWIERYGRVALTGDSDHFEDYSSALQRYYEVAAYSPQRGQFAVMVLDVTARKKADAALQESLHEKEALLKEVHHRVKNNLQVISSLLRLESGQIEHGATKEVLRNMQERVRAMALLHENLYRSGNLAQVNMGVYLGAVCQQLLRSGMAQSAGSIDLQLNLAPLGLEMNQALPCGLLVNELVSNCLKHAFPRGRDGRIRVDLQPASEGGAWCLRVEDDGVGLPAGFEIGRLHSLGLHLVSDLSRQIQGRLEFASPHGASFAVIFQVVPPSTASPS